MRRRGAPVLSERGFGLRPSPAPAMVRASFDRGVRVPHRWSFFRAGGFDQVRLDTGADFAALHELDPKLWVALSCPVTGLEVPAHTLELLDTDKDGRVRLPEVLAAVKWTVS